MSATEDAASRGAEHLDTAIAELGATAREFGAEVERSSSHAFTAVAVPQPSTDLPSGIAAFQAQATELLELVTSELGGIAGRIADKFPIGDLARAIADVGTQLPVIPAVGRLVKLAVRKVASAFNALANLIGGTALASLRDPVKKLVDKLRDQGLRAILAELVDVDGTMDHVRKAVSAPGVALAAVDRGTADLLALGPRYKRSVKYVNLAIGAGVLLNAIAATTGQVILSSAGIALLVMSLIVAVAVAKDFADSEKWMQFVRGVREIADDVRTSD